MPLLWVNLGISLWILYKYLLRAPTGDVVCQSTYVVFSTMYVVYRKTQTPAPCLPVPFPPPLSSQLHILYPSDHRYRPFAISMFGILVTICDFVDWIRIQNLHKCMHSNCPGSLT